MVEMEMRDHDRRDPGPAVPLAQAAEPARPAVEQRRAGRVDELSSVRASRIRLGGRAPNHRQLHPADVRKFCLLYASDMAEALTELIKRVPLFFDLDERELKTIAGSMKERTFPAGVAVTEEGTGGVGFFVVAGGSATVTVGGREVGRLGPGDYFGEVALIANVDRTATITTDTDLHCFGMSAWDFRPLVQEHTSIAWKLLQTLGQRLSEAERRNAS